MKRPIFEKIQGPDKITRYVFELNRYAVYLEESVRKLRRAVSYAQECIETDIPNFEAVLQETEVE